MLGRQVGTSLLRLPRCARLPIRSQPYQQLQHDLAVRSIAPSFYRAYAQITPSRPGRPKKAVGEPSRPVKRAVKRAAKSPKEDAATQKVKARRETAQKKKKAAAKPKKKTLTEEQKARQAELKAKRKAKTAKDVQKANITELKKLALDPPVVNKYSAYILFIKDRLSGGGEMKGLKHADINQAFKDRTKRITEEWRNLTPAELEHYNHLAHTTREQQLAAYKKYVESHTVEEIEAANKARRTLRYKLKDNKLQAKKWPSIKDERAVKRPLQAYLQFSINRFASGDFKHIPVKEASKLIGQEWKALSEGEKQKYQNLQKQDAARYNDEFTNVHGHAPPHALGGQEPQAAAAAA